MKRIHLLIRTRMMLTSLSFLRKRGQETSPLSREALSLLSKDSLVAPNSFLIAYRNCIVNYFKFTHIHM